MIGSVKEQVARRVTTASTGPERETFAERDVELLGSLGRVSYVKLPDNREVKLRGPVLPARLDEAGPDTIVVTKVSRGTDGRPRTDAWLGQAVESGSYEKLAARKAYRPRERRRGPVDALAELRTPSPRQPVKLAPDDDSHAGIIRGALSPVCNACVGQ